jgi:hypothetical protein
MEELPDEADQPVDGSEEEPVDGLEDPAADKLREANYKISHQVELYKPAYDNQEC